MKYLMLILVLSVGMKGVAQVVYEPGYVVTVSGDTLYGEIGRRDWTTTLSAFTFRQAGKVKRLEDAMVSEVVIPGWEVNKRLRYGDWVFYGRRLVSSTYLSLFENDELGYFVADAMHIERLYIDEPESNTYPGFIYRLAELGSAGGKDCSKIRQDLYLTFRTTYSVTAVVMELNRVKAASQQYDYRKRKPIMVLSAGGGLASYHVTQDGSDWQIGHMTFNKPTISTLQCNIEATNPWHSPRFTVFGAITLYTVSMQGIGFPDVQLSNYDRAVLRYRQTSLLIGAGVYYKLFSMSGGRIDFRVGAKGGYAHNIYRPHQFTYYAGAAEDKPLYDVITLGYGCLFADMRAGLVIKPLHLDLTFVRQFPNVIGGTDNIDLFQSLWGAEVAYRITLSK